MDKSMIGTKYHGMTIVSDTDQITPRNNYILESNSSGTVIFRHYDDNMYEDQEPVIVDLLVNAKHGKMSASNFTGNIKRFLGKNSMLISESVVNLIEALANIDIT